MAHQKHRPCSVCKHPERHRIEVLRLGGIPVDRIVESYSTLRRDAVYRHMANHVSNDTKAAIVADIPLSELAKRAADEGRSLFDYFAITRSTVMQSMQMAASVNDYTGTAALAKRAVEVNREIGRLTGEMLNSAPVQHVTNNTVFMASPAFMQLERMLLERLAPHPAALRAVLDGLEALQGAGTPSLIEHQPHKAA